MPHILNIPLFPLNTVLFPHGLLPLRVFEVRYTDMVRDCLRLGTPFGVVNIASGVELAQPDVKPDELTADSSALTDIKLTGTLATIVDFDMQEPGVLMIAAYGGQRFTVQSTHAQADGLLRAQVTVLENSAAHAVPTEQIKASQLLEQIVGELQKQHDEALKQGHKPFVFPVAKPYAFDDAGWVADRYTEFMPLPRSRKQTLLENNDPLNRMAWIWDLLNEKGVL